MKTATEKMNEEGCHENEKKADRRLARKIAWATMPYFCAVYCIQFIDKFILNYSAVLGLLEDIHLTGTQFSWAGSIFFVGFVGIQIFNQYFLQRVPIAKYLGALTIFWGISVGCTALVSNFPQLAGLRFLVGFFEGSTYTCICLLIGMFFRRKEQVLWLGVLMMVNFVGMAVSGLFGYAIGYMDGLQGLSAWQWLMIIWGSVTTLLGITLFLFLPDTTKSRFFRLTPQEDRLMDERIRDNATVRSDKISFAHIREAIKEPQYYCYIIANTLMSLKIACSTTFSSQMIRGMGFSNLNSVLLNIPIAVVTMLLIALGLYLNRRFQQLFYVIILLTFITLTGLILLCALPNGPIQLLGIYLCNPAPASTIVQASVVNNVVGYTKKTFYLGSLMACYSLGNFIGPLMMLEREAPRYYSGLTGFIIADVVCCCLYVTIRWIYRRENLRRQKMDRDGMLPPIPENREELDLTDREDLHFYYRL
ncbi:major facilitator superfamily domain-containing protein [Fennellomyces sp. T-0311]|nr:major facilitator superfamily domain-containing protein [Fennellomyces sp. T-0311]